MKLITTIIALLVTLVTVSSASAHHGPCPIPPPPPVAPGSAEAYMASPEYQAYRVCLFTPTPRPAPKPAAKPKPKVKPKVKPKPKRKHHVVKHHHHKHKVKPLTANGRAKAAVKERLSLSRDPVTYPSISCIRITSTRYECEWHGLSRLDVSYGRVGGSGGSATVFFNGNRALVRLF